MTQIPLIKGDSVGIETDYRDAIPENMIAVVKPIRGAKGYMISHYGLTQLGTGSGIDRGGYWNSRQNVHYRVSGGDLISLEADGSTTVIGSISGDKRASMINSFNSQSIVADGKWWTSDGTTLTQQTIPSNFDGPIDHTWIDNFYFFTDGTDLFHTTALDETVINPISFGVSQFSPDPTLAVDKTSDNQVIVLNRYTTEYFRNTGGDDFSFTRISNKSVKCGIVGTHCETELEGTFYLLGGGKEESVSVHYITAGTYQSIATREVDKVIATYTEEQLSDAVLETRSQDKDRLILVRLPSHTLLYNATVAKKMGIEFAWTIVKTGTDSDPWRAANGVNDPRISKWVYGDTIDSRIGVLDKESGSQYGDRVESVLYTPLAFLEGMSVDEIEIKILPGHQTGTSDVTSFLSDTVDGVTYNKEHTLLYGEKGSYGNRFIAYRWGKVDDFIGWKLRTVTTERLAFSFMDVKYG